MAREGNSIIGINACKGGTPILVEYILDKDSTSGTIETTPTGWKISLLSGIEINVNSWGNRFMDIFVKGVKAELNKYDGLCSITGLNNAICTTACEHHRVPETKSFFSITSSNLPTCVQPYSVPACRCTGGDRRIEESVRVACATPPNGDFLIKLDMSTVCNTRRRRSVAGVDQNSYEDLISIDDFNNVFLAPIPIYPATTTRRPSTTRFTQPGLHLHIAHRGISGNSRSILNSRSVARVASVDIVSMTIDAEQATTRCRESLRSSTIYSLCNSRVDTTIIISTCALDVQSLNDYSPTQSVPSQFARACLDSIVLALESPQSRDNVMYQNLKNLLSQVERLVCPSQCNGRGQCVNGKCVCNSDFMGSDCSLRRGQIPTVSTIISPVCDIFMHPCKSILVLATNVASSESVTCKMRSINGSIGNVPSVQYSTPSISGGVVVCSLPSLPIDRNNAGGPRETVFVVSVSISNDGQTYSEERLFTVYDSRYMTPNCWRQASKCAIRGRCFAAGDRCVTDNSKLCNPSKCPTKWTAESSSGCSDGFEDCI